MIDWARVAELQDDFGADDFDEIVALFMDEVEQCLSQLATGSGNLAEHLHFVKGSSANLGFTALQQLCETLERSQDASQTPQIAALYQASKQQFLGGLAQRQAG